MPGTAGLVGGFEFSFAEGSMVLMAVLEGLGGGLEDWVGVITTAVTAELSAEQPTVIVNINNNIKETRYEFFKSNPQESKQLV
jgi:hypothetical protein